MKSSYTSFFNEMSLQLKTTICCWSCLANVKNISLCNSSLFGWNLRNSDLVVKLKAAKEEENKKRIQMLLRFSIFIVYSSRSTNYGLILNDKSFYNYRFRCWGNISWILVILIRNLLSPGLGFPTSWIKIATISLEAGKWKTLFFMVFPKISRNILLLD